MAQDIFQQMAIEKIYQKAYEQSFPGESRSFVSEDDAIEWLFEGKASEGL